MLYPLVDTPHRLPTVPGEQTLLSTTSSPGRWRRTAASAGCSRRSPRGRRRVLPSGTPPASPSIPISSRPPRRCGRGTRCAGRPAPCPAPGPGRRHLAGQRCRRPPATAASIALPVRRRGPRRARPRAARRPRRAGRRRRGRDDRRRSSARRCSTPPRGLAAECSTRPALDDRRRGRRAGRGARRRVACDGGACRGRPAGRSRSRSLRRRRCSAVLTDPLLARAASVRSDTRPASWTRRSPAQPRAVRPGRHEPAARHPGRRGHPGLPRPARGTDGRGPVVVAPPHVWTTDATGRPRAARRRRPAARLRPMRPRRSPTSSPPDPPTPGPARRPADPLQVSSRDIPIAVLESVREMHTDVLGPPLGRRTRERRSAPRSTPRSPRLQAVLRPVSATWHGRPDLAPVAPRTPAATRIGELRDSIRVLAPPSPYSLGTSPTRRCC